MAGQRTFVINAFILQNHLSILSQIFSDVSILKVLINDLALNRMLIHGSDDRTMPFETNSELNNVWKIYKIFLSSGFKSTQQSVAKFSMAIDETSRSLNLFERSNTEYLNAFDKLKRMISPINRASIQSQQCLLKYLVIWRHDLAEKIDLGENYIFSDQSILNILKTVPNDMDSLRSCFDYILEP
ncbi:MAG: hypothetical protein MHPSP_001624, partial [Paramarteilia canceri]